MCIRDRNSNSVTDPQGTPGGITGTRLLGLSNGRILSYLQTDTVISVDPFTIDVTTSGRQIKLSGGNDQWVVSDGDQPILNLLTTSEGVVQNGYWREVSGVDSIFYFASPPLLMRDVISESDPWSAYTGWYGDYDSGVRMSFYYAHFGFYVTRTFVGTEDIIIPAGGFNAYRFDVELYLVTTDLVPVGMASEYYVPDVGPVLLQFESGPLKRSLSLVSYSDASTL